jgi:hypothetical protein
MPSFGNGFFNGGYADGYEGARKTTLAEEELATNTKLKERALTLEESNAKRAGSLDLLKQADSEIEKIYGIMQETAQAQIMAGAPPEKMKGAVDSLAQHAVDLYHATGRDPSMFLARKDALLSNPLGTTADTPDAKNYQFYAASELAAGRKPMDFEPYQQSLKRAGATNNSVVMNGENSFAKGLGEKISGKLVEQRDGALEASDMLRDNTEARKLLKDGVITGTAADYKVSFGKALKLAGINFAEDEIANTEAFAASRAQVVGKIIKLFGAGTGLSDADRDYATQAAAGKITLNEASIKKILDMSDRASRNVLKRYNKDAKKVQERLIDKEGNSMIPFDLTVEEPGDPILDEARDAIAKGVPREAVIKRLQDNKVQFDPKDL